MEHPERYPTPTLTPRRWSSGRLSGAGSDPVFSSDEDEDPPPPYPGVVPGLGGGGGVHQSTAAARAAPPACVRHDDLDIAPRDGHGQPRDHTASQRSRHGRTAEGHARGSPTAARVPTSHAASDETRTAGGLETTTVGGIRTGTVLGPKTVVTVQGAV